MPSFTPKAPNEAGDIFVDSNNGVTYSRNGAGQWIVVSNKQGKFKGYGEFAPVFLGAEPKDPVKGHVWYPLNEGQIGTSYIYDGSSWIPVQGGSSGPIDLGTY
jgi:hypothetical protein